MKKCSCSAETFIQSDHALGSFITKNCQISGEYKTSKKILEYKKKLDRGFVTLLLAEVPPFSTDKIHNLQLKMKMTGLMI